MIKFVPMRYWDNQIINYQPKIRHVTYDQKDILDARQIARITAVVAKILPLELLCLAQAMACRRMLRRRNIDTKLLIGVRKKSEINQQQNITVDLHAWLMLGDNCLIGRSEYQTYQKFERMAY